MKRNKKKRLSKASVLKGTRGAISLFLAMLMVPFTTLAGALLTAARVNSASSIYDEIISNSADSTLAEWDSFLKNRFGLLAVQQNTDAASGDEGDTKINSTFSKYVNRNTAALSNTFFDVKTNCTGLYSLADTQVLKNQILEYSKLSVPTLLVYNGLDIDGIIKSFENLIPGKNWLGLISNSFNLGSSFVDLGTAYDNLADAAREKETAKGNYDTSYTSLQDSLSALSSKIAEKNRVLAEYDNKISTKQSEVSSKQSTYNSLLKESEKNSSDINALTSKIDSLNEISDKIEEASKSGATVCGESKDLTDAVEEAIKNSYLTDIDDLENLSLSDLKETLEEKIKATEKSKSDLEKSNKGTSKESNNAKKALNSAQTELNKIKTEKNQKETEFNNAIDTLKQTANTNKSSYEGYIGDLISKLNAEKTKMSAANNAKQSVLDSTANLGMSAMSALSEGDKAKLRNEAKAADNKIADLKEKLKNGEITQEDYNATVGHYGYVKDMVNEAETNADNTKKLYDVASETVTKAINSKKTEFNDFNDQYYDAEILHLGKLKDKVSNFSVDNVGESFSTSDFKASYYISISVLTETMVDEAQDAILKELTKASLWDTIKLLFEVLESFIKIIMIYDPNLNTNIDTDYYRGIKDGWKTSEINLTDKENSDIYKKLFGDFSATDLNADNGLDFGACIKSIFTDISEIYKQVSGIGAIKSLLNFGKAYSEIEKRMSNIKTQFSNIVTCFTNLVSKTTMYSKTLVTGYLSYNTSCRTNYSSGRALTGASFNLRSQSTSYETDYSNATSIGDFVNMFSKALTGSPGKCFVGAEQEYLINGENSEIANQLWTFLEIYGLRLICDVVPIVASAEVTTMATACGPFGWLVYLLEILIEPLIDTLLLTSGGEVALVKNQPFLVPSGISSLISAVLKVTLTDAQKNANKQACVNELNKFAESCGGEKYKDPTNGDNKDRVESFFHFESNKTLHSSTENIYGAEVDTSLTWTYKRYLFTFNYQDYLFLYMCFCSQDTLISRFRDIVEYEAVQNLVNDGKNVFYTDDASKSGVFDLSKSYTYLRCESSFSTNEFIRLSGSNINMKTRVLYRGY